jgi:hypothetical protein
MPDDNGDGVLPRASETSIKTALGIMKEAQERKDAAAPKLVQLHDGPTLRDIPGMLRKLASDIEAGEHGEITAVVAVALEATGGGRPIVFGWGDTDDIHTIGILHLGIGFLVAHEVRRR